ncbi:RHS repeat-associated core domain-containing protein [Dehalobacterium formicoaceticum]|uniref:RHS repeat-associated core domain-containing protein n=1 Tax=Dehalobacterium formicoaceticum TaxID=51515 RepID=UPI0031F6E8B8
MRKDLLCLLILLVFLSYGIVPALAENSGMTPMEDAVDTIENSVNEPVHSDEENIIENITDDTDQLTDDNVEKEAEPFEEEPIKDEEPTKIVDEEEQQQPNDSLSAFQLLSRLKSFSEATDEEKKIICDFFGVDPSTMTNCAQDGYNLLESLKIANITKEFEFSIDEAAQLLLNNNDLVELNKELRRFQHLIRTSKSNEIKTEQAKGLFLKGYTTDQIKKALAAAEVLELDVNDIIIDETARKDLNIENYEELLPEDIETLKEFADDYFVDLEQLISGVQEKGIKPQELKNRVLYYEFIQNSTDGTASMMSGSEIQFDRYFTSPFHFQANQEEKIVANNGTLQYDVNLLDIPGRNGLDLNITLRYDSAQSNLYKPICGAELDYSYQYEVWGGAEGYYYRDGIGTGDYNQADIKYQLIGVYNTLSKAETALNNWLAQSYIVYDYWSDGTDLIVDYYGDIYQVVSDVDWDYYNDTEADTFAELNNNLGSGWSFGFPSIEDDGDKEYLHLGDGSVYEIDISPGSSNNLVDYYLEDIKIERDYGNFSNGVKNSYYVLIHKNGTREYFARDGRYLGIKDRYGNTIKFEHSTINGHPVISKITDTLGRIVTINSRSTSPGKTIKITCPDNTYIECILDPVPNKSGEYVLKKIKDQKGRETSFDYTYDTGNFTFFSKTNRSEPNIYANLGKVTYPTSASTEYTFEKAVGNFGNEGSYEYYRVKKREDKQSSLAYNTINYSYDGEYSGYPSYEDPKELPDTFTYRVLETDANNTQTEYFFNSKHLLTKKTVKKNGTTLLREYIYEYDSNQLLSKEKVKKLNESGNSDTIETSWDYNSFGDLLTVTDPYRHQTEYTYDDKFHIMTSMSSFMDAETEQRTEFTIDTETGNIERKKQILIQNGADKSIITDYGYDDDNGNLIVETTFKADGTDIITDYTYSPSYNEGYLTGISVETTDYKGNQATIEENYDYDFNTGRVSDYWDGADNHTQYEYDNLGRLTAIINPDTTEQAIVYDDILNIVTATMENGYQKRNIYDGLGNLIKEQEKQNGTWITLNEYHYNLFFQRDWMKDAKGNKDEYQYDIFNRVIKMINPDLTYSEIVYNDVQRNKVIINEEQDLTIEYYDKLGNVIQETSMLNSIAVNNYYSYDYMSNLKYVKDPNLNQTEYFYDSIGRMTEVKNARGESTKYEYDQQNNITKIIYPDGFFARKYYDELGRLIAATDPNQKTEYYVYDHGGNLAKAIDRTGRETLYTYDSRNRILSESSSGESMVYTYNDITNIRTVTDSSGTTAYEYSDNGRLKKESRPGNIITQYAYDNNGSNTQITDPFLLAADYDYDTLNRLDKVTAGGKVFDYQYYNDGMIKKIVYPGSLITTDFTYDDLNRLTGIVNKKGTTVISSYSYSYDHNGNIVSANNNGSSVTYDYDQLNRLEEITNNNGLTKYSYDNRGNREFVTGNLPFENAITGTFTYDPFDRQDTFVTGTKTYSYEYKPEGIRSKKTGPTDTVQYYSDYNGRVIAEGNASGQVTAQNVWGHQPLARKINGTYYYYLYNGHGDVVQVVDESGNIKNSYTYDEWGNILNKTEQISNPIRYAGEYYDEETGNYYLRARYYDPSIGRFIAEDPYEGSITNPLSLNLYTYCENDPIRFVDSTGNWPELTDITRTSARWLIANPLNVHATQQGWFKDLFYAAGFVRDSGGVYHARQDALQQYGGFNDFYDVIFDYSTSMKRAKFEFTSDSQDYVFWAWKGDYLNLGAGAELGIYKRLVISGLRTDHWLVDTKLAMTMTLTLNDNKENQIFSYRPSEKQWWITGFNPYYQKVSASDLTAIYTVIFNNRTMYNDFLKSDGYLMNKDKWSIIDANKYKMQFKFQ